MAKNKTDKQLSLVNTTKPASFANLPVVSNGSLEEYISFVNSIPLLTQDEEITLAHKWHDEEDVEAARYLVLSHLRLVVSIARNYVGYGLPLADIIQEGTIGLMKAVKKFDPKRGVRLVTFAIYWIRAEINEYVIKNWRIVRTVTTKSQRKLFFNLRSHRNDVGNLSDDEAKRLALEFDVSQAEVVDMNMRLTGGDVSLISADKDSFAPADYLADEDSAPDKLLERKQQYNLQTEGIEKALQVLDDRSRDIICARWLNDVEEQRTLVDLAQEYGISAERVRQIEVKALQKMKEYLKDFQD
jgi:RNA polymerase sigma-32 factor